MEKKGKVKEPIAKGVAKVPVVMQLEALECGAASLTMVLAYYEKWIPLEQVRSDCGVSRDGSNAKNLLQAARSYGMKAQGYRMEPEALKQNGKFPCIIHWNFNHFVVLDGFKGDKAYLNDPARGAYPVSMETFDQSFTGICLMIEPGEEFEPGGRPKSILGFARKRLAGAGGAVVMTILLSVISTLMSMINPAFSRIFLDRLLTGQNPDWAAPFLAAFTLMCVVQLAISWIQTVSQMKINGKLAVVGCTSYMWKVLRMPMDFFTQRLAGDIQSRKSGNASAANTLISTFTPLALQAFMMVFYLVVMVRYSLLLSLFGIASVLVNLLVSNWISKKRINITRVQMRDAGKLSAATVSGIEMIETIKASGAENGYFQKWAGYQASVNAQKVRFAKLNQYVGMIPNIVNSLTDVAVLMIGVWLVVNGRFTVGMIMAFQGFLGSFTDPATELISAGQTIQEMRTEMERIEDVMEYPVDINEDGSAVVREGGVGSLEDAARGADAVETPPRQGSAADRIGSLEDAARGTDAAVYDKLSGNVEMRHVTFGYAKLGKPLIRDFSLSLKPGSRVAFVGASGCGKSTLANLLSGLYRPWEGDILFDGKPIEQIDRSVFTGSLAVVDQDIILFEDTIANNIKMWDDSIEDFEMILAARDAHLHEDIMMRDGGYQYKITEGGKDFSGGQRQRLEIARVLAQDPTIIILDEATSALDAKTEYEVVQSIKDRGITCIVIAHRLSTIRDCDEIVVLDHGLVVERGTHEELYAKGGAYTQLVASE
ncbi:MAG: NHLP family bacteriocin export ABC transporter peptidase/permease/ATPase subunit [Lachnospiraceae bacterium]|nr:NHLP family bacteriocin export ABC transporter peptidase/permease/ATPase subunit [Lachnospiraceae bacterium]